MICRYGTYPDLCGILHKYIKLAEKVLVVGCGNSQLSADMYDVGYHNIINIDISDITVKQMVEKNKEKRPEMKFLQMDALKVHVWSMILFPKIVFGGGVKIWAHYPWQTHLYYPNYCLKNSPLVLRLFVKKYFHN